MVMANCYASVCCGFLSNILSSGIFLSASSQDGGYSALVGFYTGVCLCHYIFDQKYKYLQISQTTAALVLQALILILLNKPSNFMSIFLYHQVCKGIHFIFFSLVFGFLFYYYLFCIITLFVTFIVMPNSAIPSFHILLYLDSYYYLYLLCIIIVFVTFIVM